jgi:SAM-dependent methyltransferase
MPKNIAYQSDRIAGYYAVNRRRWNEFYPSERWVFERIAAEHGAIGRVLDVGCAAGGLGEALAEHFGSVTAYTGIDINRQAIAAAEKASDRIAAPNEFIAADVCDCPALAGRRFDLVTALSVADWNVDAHGIVDACWERVAPGGTLVMSLRLTTDAGVCDVGRSFQFIWFDPTPIPAGAERAPYNVFNSAEAIAWLAGQVPRPEKLLVKGYWGTPSATARTPYRKLIFAVVAMRKALTGTAAKTEIETHLPDDAFTTAS